MPYDSYVSLSAHFLIAEKDKTARGLSAASLRIIAYPIIELRLFGKGTESLGEKVNCKNENKET